MNISREEFNHHTGTVYEIRDDVLFGLTDPTETLWNILLASENLLDQLEEIGHNNLMPHEVNMGNKAFADWNQMRWAIGMRN